MECTRVWLCLYVWLWFNFKKKRYINCNVILLRDRFIIYNFYFICIFIFHRKKSKVKNTNKKSVENFFFFWYKFRRSLFSDFPFYYFIYILYSSSFHCFSFCWEIFLEKWNINQTRQERVRCHWEIICIYLLKIL